MSRAVTLQRRVVAAFAVFALVVVAFVVAVVNPDPAEAVISPLEPRPSDVVTADSLPTAQINGVAWDQEVVGNTVYVGGSFTQARPAGAAAGTNQSARSNVMAYTLSTGVMTAWNPTVNGQVRVITLSPDGTRIYIGGDFTQVNGQSRGRIAAFSTATGALVTTFAPNITSSVRDITVIGSTVYAGGSFQSVGNQARQNLAAFNASNGALLAWAPLANRPVMALDATEDGQDLIVGGHFETVNGGNARGLAKIDAATGTLKPWPVLISNAGADSAILSVKVENGTVYGSGYHFGAGGNQEGAWRINVETGALVWVADCHGDTYDVFPGAGAVYAAGHSHYCGNVGLGFPQYDPWKFQHNMAWTHEATGTNIREVHGYANWAGQPSPSNVHWNPTMAIGTFTGQSQASWTVEGNDDYVVVGGEFPRVNGAAQQGLVRFAVAPIAPGSRGPQFHNNQMIPTLQPHGAGSVKVSWNTGWDMDDQELTYEIRRTPGGLVSTQRIASNWWHTPGASFVDSGLTPGQSYSYSIWVTDGSGNRVFGASRSIVAPASFSLGAYGDAVVADDPSIYWPLGDAAGSTTVTDQGGGYHGIPGTGVTFGVADGPVAGTSAVSVNNTTNGRIHAFGSSVAPTEYSAEVWFRTSATSGRLLGFGDLQVGNSGHRDRQIYLTNNGRVHFGIRADGTQVLSSPAQYNNNQWNQAVVTLTGSSARLYVNGALVAQRNNITDPEQYIGHWRLGGDNQSGWPSAGNANFNGSIGQMSIYDYALTPNQVNAHYVASGRTSALPTPPTDDYGSAVFDEEPDLYWRLGESSGTTANDAGWMRNNGTYQGGHTKSQTGAVLGTTDTAVAFNGSTGFVASSNTFANPQLFSTEAWFRTTTTSGGKIIGFGSSATGLSTNYDRHVYMLNTGQLRFGVYTGAEQLITSPQSYNDGEWHHVVSSLSPSGMRLFVDGVEVGTNPTTAAQSYTGYWRVGGDRVWSGSTSNYFNGSIDEVAVYSRALTSAEVLSHYSLGSGDTPNVPPVAAFTFAADELAVSFDGRDSTDSDGSVSSYAWTFGDDTTGTGATPSHTYAAAGTYDVTLTVTDNGGATHALTKQVTVAATPNVPPVAAFTFAADELAVSFDAGGSSDADGSITGYAWSFGDGETATGETTSHTYAEAGTYDVTVTVTDNDGATHALTKQVTVAATPPPTNVAPVAAFTFAADELAVSFDGRGSSDSDGSISSYAWTFGDDTTGTGATPSHTYAAAGTYGVTLTVTDDDGATHALTQQVTVTQTPVGPVVLAEDAFGRTLATGWGTADLGGTWAPTGSSANWWVADGQGVLRLQSPGSGPAIRLNGMTAMDSDMTVQVSLSAKPTVGDVYVSVAGRQVGNDGYRVKVRFMPTQTMVLITQVVGGTETNIANATISGANYQVGDVFNVRFRVAGEGTTSLQAKIWKTTQTEPAAWQLSTTSTTAALQRPGGTGVIGYLSGSANVSPVLIRVDELVVTTPAG